MASAASLPPPSLLATIVVLVLAGLPAFLRHHLGTKPRASYSVEHLLYGYLLWLVYHPGPLLTETYLRFLYAV